MLINAQSINKMHFANMLEVPFEESVTDSVAECEAFHCSFFPFLID